MCIRDRPQDIPVDVVTEVVSWIKSRHPVYDTPITLGPTSTVGEALALLTKRAHGIVIIVEDGTPVGVVRSTSRRDPTSERFGTMKTSA